ncbi:MAG: hypothetical protein KDK39_14430 [Leptospiraceae bacterium]|nr:hypothetical protein [Leptospiraceae bacterium]
MAQIEVEMAFPEYDEKAGQITQKKVFDGQKNDAPRFNPFHTTDADNGAMEQIMLDKKRDLTIGALLQSQK